VKSAVAEMMKGAMAEVNCANVPNTEMATSPSARFDREYAR
jgi:hypothetical protein